MKVRELMTKDVSFANPNTSVEQIAKQMKELDVGCIPVCDADKHALGIVTDRDIVLRSVSQGNNQHRAQEIMSDKLIFATPDMDAHEAADLMARNQVRRLPVVEKGKLVGILAIGDLATQNIYVNEAGDALCDISKPSRPQM
ncbi:MAG: CBS domain-containing protein [Thermotaleaceae bacterium]